MSFNACSKAADGVKDTPAITNPDNGGDTGGDTAGLITTEWKNWEDGERVTTSIVDGVLIADITDPGSETYNPKVFRALTLTKGKTYTVSFTAKAETARNINVNIGKQLTTAPWFDDVMGSIKPIALTTEMKEYTFEFTASHESAPESDIIFELDNGATTKVYIKDVKVVEKTSTGGDTGDTGGDTGGIVDTTGPTVVAPSTLPTTASVLYSSDTTTGSSYATITDYSQNWYGAIAYSQVDVAGEDVLRYTSSGLSGECLALATNSFDVSSKTRFHMDIYLFGVDYFQLKFVDGSGASKMVNLHTVPDFDGALIAEGQWVTIDMAIADMSIPGGGGTISWADLRQTGILLTAASPGDKAYIDNMYFY